MVVKDFFRHIFGGLDEVCFPSVCLACGIQRTLPHQYLCPICLSAGFEEANPQSRKNASGEILPEGVKFQDALWRYHKGGVLQHLMYHLKYDYKSRLGSELGALAALKLKKRSFIDEWLLQIERVRIVPVPLHPSKLRMRGFNQARHIALGVQEMLGIPLMREGLVERSKSTVTQTDFSLKARMQNMQSAFEVGRGEHFNNMRHLIVDDVFTTGTTVFELAYQLRKAGSQEIGILTVAQA